MADFLRPKECDISGYRHGCDPPERAKADSPSQRKHQLVASQSSTQSLIRLVLLQPSLLASVFRFHKNKERKE